MEPFPSQTRNLEQDRREFARAIDAINIEYISAAFAKEAEHRLTADLTKTNLFILGEMHGVKENVDVIYTLFKKFGFKQLALECDAELATITKQYLETGDIDFEKIQDSPDGRITAGHFALLKQLQTEGLLEKLICFDGRGETTWNERDANMAQNILSQVSTSPTLVVAGNLHAKTVPIATEDEPGDQHPMGELIRKVIPDIPTGGIEYRSGQYHNFGTQDFSEEANGGLAEAEFYLTEDGLYKFALPKATAAIVPNPSERL